MSTLVANLPPIKVWVRREHLRDLRDGHGEYTLGYWVSAKAIPGRAMYFETYLPEYGAMYDKLTIDAFLSWDPDCWQRPEKPSPDLAISDLQFWNSFDYGLTVIEKNLLSNMEFEVRTRSGVSMKGKYLFTIDNYHPHRNEADFYFSEHPDEHKSHNVVELENGQIGAYPNNRCRMTDPSLSYNELKTPDFKVATRYVDVEYAPEWGRLGEQDDYFWETPEEKDAFDHVVERSRYELPKIDTPSDIYTRDGEFAEAGRDFGKHINWSPVPGIYGNLRGPHQPMTNKEAEENPWEEMGKPDYGKFTD